MIHLYQVDAFTDTVFGGNPAAVCPLPFWPEDALLQQIAMEMNLSETAFFVEKDGSFQLRWFTPLTEVRLCGHATLATAHVLFTRMGFDQPRLVFNTKSGKLFVWRNGEKYTLDFPADFPTPVEHIDISGAINILPVNILRSRDDLMFIYTSSKEIIDLKPDYHFIGTLPYRGVIATAPGENVDFVSRFFAPACGIDEDPVTGSAHTVMTPYWSKVLGKTFLTATQLSKRGGYLECRVDKDRVLISGKAVSVLEGQLNIRI